MSLKFSITKDPPTQAEIDKERNRLNKLRLAEVVAAAAVFLLLFTVAVVEILALHLISPPSADNIFAGAFLLSVATIVICIAGFIVDYISRRLYSLCAIDPPNLDTAIGYCDAYPEIAAYRNKVVRLDRKLTNGEFEAMEEYKQTKCKQNVAAKYEEKLNKLHTEKGNKIESL